jgi:hypothetical protein
VQLGGSGHSAETNPRADRLARGIRLGWVGADDKEEPAVDTVMERLRGDGILVIIDNAIDANALKIYLPRGGAAKLLVASNAHACVGSRSRSKSGCGPGRSAPTT